MAGDIDIQTACAADSLRWPIVETASGRVAGVTSGGGGHVLKGIPLGASTAGANRFMPPRKPEPWTGVRETIIYAGRSPQAATGARHPELATILARYLVEYFYRKLEQSRAIATCHDKTVRNFLAGIHLAATFICLN